MKTNTRTLHSDTRAARIAVCNTLDTFTRAYLVTALWSSTGNNDEPLDRAYSLQDYSPAALAMAIRDCAAFQRGNAIVISAAIESGEVVCGPDFDELGRAGHDFWLTRNGHGAGFWDGDWPDSAGRALTDAAKVFGEVSAYVGDDGAIHFDRQDETVLMAAGLHWSQTGRRKPTVAEMCAQSAAKL